MNYISAAQISELNISPAKCVEWVRESFLLKPECSLPPKTSLHFGESDFINTMPCLLPDAMHTYGCKIVSRISSQNPKLNSELTLIDTLTGNKLALMDANWITAMRTGAVAALAINTFRNSQAKIYSFMGLGTVGRTSLECFLATNPQPVTVRILKYKNHAEQVIKDFSHYQNVTFEIADTLEELAKDADVIVSAITYTENPLFENTEIFKPGVLLVPVHTRGFQNCDKIFDKIYGDDYGHISGFKYFNEFRHFAELSDVLSGKAPGRDNDSQRIISYNIGLGLHDVIFGKKILELLRIE